MTLSDKEAKLEEIKTEAEKIKKEMEAKSKEEPITEKTLEPKVESPTKK